MTYVVVSSILVVFSVLSADPNLDYVGAGSAPLNGGCAAVCAVPRSIPTPTPPHPTYPPLSDVNGI